MSVRIWAAIASAMFAVLLVWVAALSFGPERPVVPSVSVSATQPTRPATTASEVLADRTRLQAETFVADGKRTAELLEPAPALQMQPGVAAPRIVVQGWMVQEPRDPATFFQAQDFRSGISTLPYRMSDVLVQPQGRDFRAARNDQIRYGGGWLIFGTALALALFLLGRGRIRIAEGESGEGVLRFNALERANHWMTASSFIIMGLTGLVILYGKSILLPWMSASAFSTLAQASAWLHMASAVPFVLGVLLMIVLWVGGNLPSRLDWEWLKRGGGFLRDDGHNPPARRFNAGQKIVFWGVVLGGLGLLATGVMLMFPFYWAGYDGMQWAQLIHGGIALAMIALILGHIYIGSVGMVGAFQAMWSGRVDRNWAKEHHSLWYREVAGSGQGEERRRTAGGPGPVSRR